MKTSGIICLCIAILLIVLNILVDLANPQIFNFDDPAYGLGYIIGAHLFIVLAIGLLIIPYIQIKRINKENARYWMNPSKVLEIISKLFLINLRLQQGLYPFFPCRVCPNSLVCSGIRLRRID